jgi:ABC-type Zn uptake system ZnuABC Zn-binding protein ZnuA
MSDDLHEVKTDVEILKRDVSNIQGLLTRLDTAIDKIADASGGISKILAVHESEIDTLQEDIAERKRLAEKETELLHRRISEMKEESAEHHRMNHVAVMAKLDKMDEEFNRELKDVSKRVYTLEKWKWWIMGGSWAIGFIIATLLEVNKILG